MSKKINIKGLLFPLIAAFIWGTAFPMQSICAEYIPAFSMNSLRSVFASICLFIVCLFVKKKKSIGSFRDIAIGSIICGLSLFGAANLQQLGMQLGTDAGKAGFITALYCVLVPLLRLFKGQKAGVKVWIAIAFAVFGLFLLCVKGDFSFAFSDLLIVGCALCFAIHILLLDRVTDTVHPLALSCGQFLVVGILSGIVAIFFEGGLHVETTLQCLPEFLYMAILSSCVAYTLQVFSLEEGNPTITSILYSLESVFAVLSGVLILGERLSGREVLGCILMFIGVLLAEVPMRTIRLRAYNLRQKSLERLKKRRERKEKRKEERSKTKNYIRTKKHIKMKKHGRKKK